MVKILLICFLLSSSDSEWDKFVKNTDSLYETWQHDNPNGNRTRFLNDKLITMVPIKDVKGLKKIVFWLALYHKYQEPLPENAQKFIEKYENKLEELSIKIDGKNIQAPDWEELLNKINKIKEEEIKKEGKK